jgi:hypothetical protein
MDQDQKRVGMAYDAIIRGTDGYGAGRLAEDTGVHVRKVNKWAEAVISPSLVAFRSHLRILRDEGRGRDLDLLEKVLADLGYELRHAPREAPAESVLAGGLHVAAETGDLTHALEDATSPASPGGVAITPDESAAIAHEAYEVERAAKMLRSRALGAPSPQLRMVAVQR